MRRDRPRYGALAAIVSAAMVIVAASGASAAREPWQPLVLVDHHLPTTPTMQSSYLDLFGAGVYGVQWQTFGHWGSRWGGGLLMRNGTSGLVDTTWSVQRVPTLNLATLTFSGTTLFRTQRRGTSSGFPYFGLGAGANLLTERIALAATRSEGTEFVNGTYTQVGISAEAHALMGIQIALPNLCRVVCEVQWTQSGPAALYRVGTATNSDYAPKQKLFEQQVRSVARLTDMNLTGFTVSVGFSPLGLPPPRQQQPRRR